MAEQLRKMKLGQTDGFRYIGFEPPLTAEELESLPLPKSRMGREVHEWGVTSVEHFADNNSMDVGFNADAFGVRGEFFPVYAAKVAQHLGGCSLETEVHFIGPGSVIAQAEGAPAGW